MPEQYSKMIETYPWAADLLGIFMLAVVCFVAYFVAKTLIRQAVERTVRSTTFTWDDVLSKRKVFVRLADLAPIVLAYQGITVVPGIGATVESIVQRLASAGAVVVIVLLLNGFLHAANDIYSERSTAKHKPIKGYIQIVQIFVFLFGAVIFVAALLNRSPWLFMSGIGAMTAVLMLVFKDTILSLVASVQLASNDMVRLGDWIEMPSMNADGAVIDMALHTVKIQNWDKTVTTIPTYTLISNGFKNWRTMPLAGGRRIKRAIFIDANTIRHLSEEEIERFSHFVLLRDHVAKKKAELEAYNKEHCPDPSYLANARRLTNMGTFRAYAEAYLRQHPGINQNLTLMVRQLAPTPTGLPLEIYAFTNRTEWPIYEGIQADIFDHLLAIAPEFGLRIYQSPAGLDLQAAFRRPTDTLAVE